MPVVLMFFFIGSILFSYYQVNPDLLQEVKFDKAIEMMDGEHLRRQTGGSLLGRLRHWLGGHDESPGLTTVWYTPGFGWGDQAWMQPNDYADNVLPHFIANQMPVGLAGLLIAALFAAAMSSIDTSLNSSSTIALQDFYRRWFRPDADEAQSLRFLRVMTIVWGSIGTGVALAIIGVKSILDEWWKISGVFAGGMLGLFLLGFISRRANNAGAAVGATIGLLVILWMTFTPEMEGDLGWLRSPFHANMITVIGTLSIFLIGLGASRVLGRKNG
jgi:SSS family solute:Na+ symporter